MTNAIIVVFLAFAVGSSLSHLGSKDCNDNPIRSISGNGVSTGKRMKMKEKAALWHDREYSVIEYSDYLEGSHYIQLPFGIPNGTVISISLRLPSEIYILTPNIRDGDFPQSLPKVGWRHITGLIENSYNRDLNNVFYKVFNMPSMISLPSTVGLGDTTMVILVKPICSDSETTTAVSTTPFVPGSEYTIVRSESCQYHGMVEIQNQRECEYAATFVENNNVSAIVTQKKGEPHGCLFADSFPKKYKLRWSPSKGSPYEAAPCGTRKNNTILNCICRVVGCGNTVYEVSESGIELTSPNYPKKYPKNHDCANVVRYTKGEVVKLTFLKFQVYKDYWDESYGCNDWVEIHDGANSIAPIIGTQFCGSKIPNAIISSRNELFIKFHSDYHGEDTGYKLQVEAKNEVRCICEFTNGGVGMNGILCEENRIFRKISACYSDDWWCTGPMNETFAIVGTTGLCEKVKLTCGNKISSPNCNLCPKNGDNMTNSWCAGNCYYDENNEMCKEDEYESFENIKCESISHDNGFTTLTDSKAECSSRSDCFGVVTNGFSYKFCTFPNSIIHQDDEDDSAILEPIVFHSKNYHSANQKDFFQHPKGIRCRKWYENVIQQFSAESMKNSSTAKFQCQKFCSQHEACWGCSIDCTNKSCQWNAIKKCRTLVKSDDTSSSGISQKTVCMGIKITIPSLDNGGLNMTYKWELDSCQGNHFFNQTNKHPNTTSIPRKKVFIERCCLTPGPHVLICLNEKNTLGWGNGVIEIQNQRYCNDFIGIRAMREVLIRVAPGSIAKNKLIQQDNRVNLGRIPLIPSDGCPEGTYAGTSTCFCEDHCSWNLCRLDHPNKNCLRKLSTTSQNNVTWKWNSNENYWVAQGKCTKGNKWSCCDSKMPCQENEGHCENDQECESGLHCEKESCPFQIGYLQANCCERKKGFLVELGGLQYYKIQVSGAMTATNIKDTCEKNNQTAIRAEGKFYSKSGPWECKDPFSSISQSICETFDPTGCEKLHGIFAFRTSETSCGISKFGERTDNGFLAIYDNNWALCAKQSEKDQKELNDPIQKDYVTRREEIKPKERPPNNRTEHALIHYRKVILLFTIFVLVIVLFMHLFYSPKKGIRKLRSPKAILSGMKLIFKSYCILMAIYWTSVFTIQYAENEDSIMMTTKLFNDNENDKYPTFSFCFKGTEFVWNREIDIFKAYRLNSTQFEMMLKGEVATKYEFNASSGAYAKVPVFVNKDVGIDQFYLQLADIFSEVKFVMQRSTQMYHSSHDGQVGSTFGRAFHLSYLSPVQICFTRKSEDPRNMIRRYDSITFNSTNLNLLKYRETNVHMQIFIHYPGQIIANLDKPKYSAYNTDLLKNLRRNGNIQTLGLKISQVQTLRKRHDSNVHCNQDIKDYDLFLQLELSKQLNCVPPYWKHILEGRHQLEECTSPEKLKMAYRNISEVKEILDWNPIPCDEMLLLSIDSIDQHPSPVPNDITIFFQYAEKIYEEIKYTRAIGFVNWLSNVGGFVGIFLGVSIMQFPDIFSCVFRMLYSNKTNLSKALISRKRGFDACKREKELHGVNTPRTTSKAKHIKEGNLQNKTSIIALRNKTNCNTDSIKMTIVEKNKKELMKSRGSDIDLKLGLTTTLNDSLVNTSLAVEEFDETFHENKINRLIKDLKKNYDKEILEIKDELEHLKKKK